VVNRKTKKKKKAPLIRLAIFIILILAIGFFIFYSIDNPQFIRGLLNMDPGPGANTESGPDEMTAEDQSGPEKEETEETILEGPGSGKEETTFEGSGPGPGDGTPIMETDPGTAKSGISWWRRILAFFVNRGKTSGNDDSFPSRITINIYYAATGEEKILASEEREIIAGSPGNALNGAMTELLKGPSKSYHFPVIPAGTELLGAKAYEGVAEIDLSNEFLENSLDSRILDEYIIYSIVNTVTEIQDINGVIFFIEGKRIKMYGNIDLSIPLIRNAELLIEEE